MASRRLYCPDLRCGPLALGGDEARHAITSLRAKSGQQVTLFDGAGSEAAATIDRIGKRHLYLQVDAIIRRPFEVSRSVTLAVAMPRTHRQGYLIEKCTELGVSAIWPMIARRSVAKPDASAVDKWARRAIEAAKQSDRAWVPVIEAPQPLGIWLRRTEQFDAALLAERDPASAGLVTFLQEHASVRSVLVFIGPEGGWADEEIAACVSGGVQPVCLSPTVLRTETAAVAVCAAAALLGSSD
jgi:16S rRNA (uracil1498-N3)-methyltransferase